MTYQIQGQSVAELCDTLLIGQETASVQRRRPCFWGDNRGVKIVLYDGNDWDFLL
jgi:hypothetical protein